MTPKITATLIDYEPIEFVVTEEGQPDFIIPIATGFNEDGTLQTARQLAEKPKLLALYCDHFSATWSSNLAIRCPLCGSAMFLPPRLLANLPAATIAAMDELWSAAGWPEWRDEAWFFPPEHWTLQQHPLFEHCGGIPVRCDRTQQYRDALPGFPEVEDLNAN